MTQPSVRQCGPRFAAGVAREIRRGLEDHARRALDAVFGPIERRRGRLRRLEVERLVRCSMRALEPISIGPAVHSADSSRRLVVFVEGPGLSIGWASFSLVTFPRGGHQVVCELIPTARLSGHALERLIHRLSTREWPLILTELSAVEELSAAAATAMARDARTVHVPTPHGALVVACDEVIPTVVTFLDDLGDTKAHRIAAEYACLLAPLVDAA